TFDIDANGILNVSAKDKATGREQSITIRASSGLSEEEIEQMVQDAEQHAADDQKFREVVEARNQADNLIHATRKAMSDLGDNVGEDEKETIENAIKELEEAMEGEDKEAIETKMQALSEASSGMAERAYQQAGGGEQAAGGEQQAGGGSADDDVVDAEFEEVDDDKRNQS
ncbi:MAG: Hsp70 family protein, partial [Thiohalospira sp.]